ncbi:MAG: FliG C-terminal domain-containing protein [Spirochaetales bacterium]
MENSEKVKRYDFKRPDKFSREQIRTMQMIHEVTARGLTAVVSTRVGTSLEVNVRAVDQLTYEEFIQSVPEESAFAVVEVPPLRGPMVIEIDNTLATLLLDAACGQKPDGQTLAKPNRMFAEIEALILNEVVDELLPSMRESWANVVAIEPALGGVETNPRDAMIVPPTEMIVLVSLQVCLGEHSSFMNFAYPYLTIEPIVRKLRAQYWYSQVRGPGSKPLLGERASGVRVPCELSIPIDPLPLAQVPSILEGSEIALPSLDRGNLDLRAGSVPVAAAFLARAQSDGTGNDRVASLEQENLEINLTHEKPPVKEKAGAALERAVNQIEPTLSDLRGELRTLRSAVEAIRQDNEPRTVADEPSIVPAGGAPTVESPRDVALLISAIRPTVIAFLLAPLDPQSAALVFSELPGSVRDQVVQALATLESADLLLHARLMTFLRRRIQTRRDSTVAGGPEAIAEILTSVPRTVEMAIMDRLNKQDNELFESVARLMFVFEDIVLVDPVALRKLAGELSDEELALALKGVSKEVSSHLLGALPEERVAGIEAADAALGRVRRIDVEEAQRAAIEELRVLEERGEVVIGRAGEVVE